MDEVSHDPRYPAYLQPVNIPSTEGMTYAGREILLHQIDLQVFYLQREIDICNIRLRLDSTPIEWKFRDEIQIMLTEAKMKLKALEDSESGKKRWRDRLQLKLYYWSVKGRLEKEEL